jgi:hypothetical protein
MARMAVRNVEAGRRANRQNSDAVMLLHPLLITADRISARANTFGGWKKKGNAWKKRE